MLVTCMALVVAGAALVDASPVSSKFAASPAKSSSSIASSKLLEKTSTKAPNRRKLLMPRFWSKNYDNIFRPTNPSTRGKRNDEPPVWCKVNKPHCRNGNNEDFETVNSKEIGLETLPYPETFTEASSGENGSEIYSPMWSHLGIYNEANGILREDYKTDKFSPYTEVMDIEVFTVLPPIKTSVTDNDRSFIYAQTYKCQQWIYHAIERLHIDIGETLQYLAEAGHTDQKKIDKYSFKQMGETASYGFIRYFLYLMKALKRPEFVQPILTNYTYNCLVKFTNYLESYCDVEELRQKVIKFALDLIQGWSNEEKTQQFIYVLAVLEQYNYDTEYQARYNDLIIAGRGIGLSYYRHDKYCMYKAPGAPIHTRGGPPEYAMDNWVYFFTKLLKDFYYWKAPGWFAYILDCPT